MLVNSPVQNPYGINNINVIQPLNKEATGLSANSMPTINQRIVQETNVAKRALNNVPPNFIRFAYSNNQTSSNGSLTENYIRSKASLSPTYVHNEIVTRYNMVSKIPINLMQIKKSVDIHA
ncbi:hypothetical protein N8310_04205 [Pseudomonadota bacterium]|nr:hypothetical protein [Pseudomonadota bacterium]